MTMDRIEFFIFMHSFRHVQKFYLPKICHLMIVFFLQISYDSILNV